MVFHRRLELACPGSVIDIKDYHIGALPHVPDAQPGDQAQAFGQRARIGMIFGEPIDHRGKRDNAGCRDYSSLPHSAAEHLANPMGARDELAAPAHQRSNRAGEPLREAERNRIRV